MGLFLERHFQVLRVLETLFMMKFSNVNLNARLMLKRKKQHCLVEKEKKKKTKKEKTNKKHGLGDLEVRCIGFVFYSMTTYGILPKLLK